MLGYFRPCQDDVLVFWFQVSSVGWDAHTGSEFTLEFQLGPVEHTGGVPPCERERFSHFLSQAELDAVQEMQNAVLARIPAPPPDYVKFMGDWVLDSLRPITRAYIPGEDVWLRYHIEDDVRLWAEFLGQRLPQIVAGIQDRGGL